MPRTRSKPTPKESTPPPAVSTTKPLPPCVANAPKLFVLPKDTSEDARIVTLDNPTSGAPSRYLFCPKKGFFEFTKIAAPKKACRSWLITSEKSEDQEERVQAGYGTSIGTGYVTKSADLLIATPIDLIFLILPALASKSVKDTKQLFLTFDDYVDRLSSSSAHWRALLSQYPTLRTMLEKRMEAFCDTVDAGDERMYRLSNERLCRSVVKKAERICAKRFPASMEEKFVKDKLNIPILSIKREESDMNANETPVNEESQVSSTPSTAADSQATTGTTSTQATTIDAADEPAEATLTTPPEAPHLLRLRTCFTYILASYIPFALHAPLQILLKSSTSPDFTTLDTHLATLARMKTEAAALRSISDNISRKRALEEDEEKVAEREEKKRKKDEEDKRKKMESRGAKQLKKVNTSGMKKLSSFFTKAPAKKA